MMQHARRRLREHMLHSIALHAAISHSRQQLTGALKARAGLRKRVFAARHAGSSAQHGLLFVSVLFHVCVCVGRLCGLPACGVRQLGDEWQRC